MSVAKSTTAVITATRRGLILRHIDSAGGFGLSHNSLQEAFDRQGRPVGIDFIKRDLQWLEQAELVVTHVDGTLTIAKLTPIGEDVAKARIPFDGIHIERS